ncbi:MAG: helix-turn-helix domain-containing protein [Oscillospiraceae bacterium]|nr:helix-turn-helix domain-containing protein [Oscillospiraceae bacterium]
MSEKLRDAYTLMLKEYPDILTTKDLKKILNLSSRKVYELIHKGQIVVIPCGRTIRVAKLSVIAYMLNISSDAA